MTGRRDLRAPITLGVVLAVALLGLAVQLPPLGSGVGVASTAADASAASQRAAVLGELDARFRQAVVMLHAQRYEYAVAALKRVLSLAPRLPEAHVNMGFAHIGLAQFATAERYFQQALALKPGQLNAYYGLALCREHAGDLDAALGAMRAYVHLADEGDSYVRRAKAAIWEWEAARDAARG